jgi:hypothetical protein
MSELYRWFEAIGQLEDSFANICRDPDDLIP